MINQVTGRYRKVSTLSVQSYKSSLFVIGGQPSRILLFEVPNAKSLSNDTADGISSEFQRRKWGRINFSSLVSDCQLYKYQRSVVRNGLQSSESPNQIRIVTKYHPKMGTITRTKVSTSRMGMVEGDHYFNRNSHLLYFTPS